MIVLGVDPGLYRLGYGIIHQEGESFLPLEAGVFRLSKALSFPGKLAAIYRFFTNLIQEYHPSVLCLEAPFVFKDPRAMGRLRSVVAVFELIAGLNDLEAVEIPPKKVRSVLLGYGGATKDQVRRWVQAYVDESMGVVVKDGELDDSDALAVALSYFFVSAVPQ
jgi:crossover junction endodeoxyribonuclease RuvC